ncbi:MAG: RNA polymerase sigma factor [Candidatus Angelobacter sp.]
MQATMQITRADAAVLAQEDFQPGLGEVFREHKNLIFRAAYRITGSPSDAEDVLQTVFLRLAGQRKSPEIKNLAAYLHRSAVNVSLDLLRSKRNIQSIPLDQDFAGLNAVSINTAGRLELRDWLRQALARLNPRWAEMFVLRFVEDYSNREVARMMGTSAAVVAVLLHRTRAQLKRDYMTVTRGTR